MWQINTPNHPRVLVMAIYDISEGAFIPLELTTFAQSDIRERDHLQQLLKSQIDVISPNTLIISEEFSNWEDSRRRIDLLGVNTSGALVVIELKRDADGGHMELQALRYAAMVTALTFDQAVDIYQDYLNLLDAAAEADARSKLLEFLDWESEEESEFAQEVQIVLASADFSKEITTTVIWLNNNGLDIRCVRMKPYLYDGRVLLDIHQVIPLPEAEAYQVQLKQKNQLARVARQQNRDLTKYTIKIKNEYYENLPKRRVIFHYIKGLFNAGVDPSQIKGSLISRKSAMRVLDGEIAEDELVKALAKQLLADGVEASTGRWFIARDEVMRYQGKTYVLTKMWGRGTLPALADLDNAFPEFEISYEAMP
jgi:hypothetical protein